MLCSKRRAAYWGCERLMAGLRLKSLVEPQAVAELIQAIGGNVGIADANSKALLGDVLGGASRVPIIVNDVTLGWVTGTPAAASAVASFLVHLAAKESERRALSTEVLHLYREVHLIEQVSEQLAALLDLSAVGKSALDQARRLITASHGSILIMENPGGPFSSIASFGGDALDLSPASRFAASTVERGVAEIVNELASDPRTLDASLGSLVSAPLRAKQRAVGVIALGNATGAPYSTTDLKLLNTIA